MATSVFVAFILYKFTIDKIIEFKPYHTIVFRLHNYLINVTLEYVWNNGSLFYQGLQIMQDNPGDASVPATWTASKLSVHSSSRYSLKTTDFFDVSKNAATFIFLGVHGLRDGRRFPLRATPSNRSNGRISSDEIGDKLQICFHWSTVIRKLFVFWRGKRYEVNYILLKKFLNTL